jgi:hypothetical protein
MLQESVVCSKSATIFPSCVDLMPATFCRICFSDSHRMLAIFLVVSSKVILYKYDRWNTCTPNILMKPGSSVGIVATQVPE